MAERGLTRRQSFRRVRADNSLPDEYLELLEQKRKQLDESIHKYIASKERDFKTFERDLRQQYKQDKQEQNQDGSRAARASLEATNNGAGSPQLRAQQQQQPQSVVDALLAAGMNREHIGQPLSVAVVDADGSPRLEAKSAAGLIDRRASIERDKEFVGVFTPAFLPALDNKASPNSSNMPERAESAPPGQSKETEQPTIIRAHSDHVVQAKAKRPVQLQLSQRTSSSGSSADGKLTSALKSPTQGTKPKRKRVSLAVGDSIVKPSDSVPTSLLNNNRTPSHSRTRSQSSDPERGPSIDAKVAEGNGTKEVEQQTTTSPQAPASVPVVPTVMPPKTNDQRTPAATSTSIPNGKAAMAPSSPLSRPPARPPVDIDPDGDLFDLEEEDMMPNGAADAQDLSDEDGDIAGRVDRKLSIYGDDDISAELSSEAEPEEDRAEHVEFMPSSANASQQPTNPGFRRPSATLDPIYSGADYNRAEHSAVVNDVYGSSYNRPPTKGSFTSGSLGESFMARNAQHMRERSGSKSYEQPQVR